MGLIEAALAVWIVVGLVVLLGRVNRLHGKFADMEHAQQQRFQVIAQTLQRLEAALAAQHSEQAHQEAKPREKKALSAPGFPQQAAESGQPQESIVVPAVPPARPTPAKPAFPPPTVEPAPAFSPIPSPKAPPAAPERRIAVSEMVSEPPLTQQHSRFEQAAREVLRRTWNWITVGDQRGVKGTSYEFALATHWLVRIGVVILVLGVGFFLRYSIQHGWISESARVVLAATTGVLMIAGGVTLLGRRYHLLAQGLLGGGVAVLYFSVYAAANFYQLISAVPTAFALMVVVAVLAGILAVLYDTQLMAVLGLLLGLLTPVVLRTGTVHYLGLNTFLLALGTGVIFVSLWKDWPALHLLAFHGIYGLMFFSWQNYRSEFYLEVFPFLVGQFVLFSLLAVVRHLFLRLPGNLLDLFVLLGNFAMMFFAGGVLTYRWLEFVGYSTRYSALLPLGLLLFYAAQAYYLLYARIRDAGLWASCVALAAFSAATVPVLFLGSHWSQWLMPSWAFLGTVLIWLGLRLRSSLLPRLGALFLAGALLLFVFWEIPARARAPLPAAAVWLEYLLQAVDRLAPSLLSVLALAGTAWIIQHPPRPAGLAWDAEDAETTPLAGLGTSWRLFLLMWGMLLFVLGWDADRAMQVFAPQARPLGLTFVWATLAAGMALTTRDAQRGERSVWVTVAVVPLVLKWLWFDLQHWEWGPGFAFSRGVSLLGAFLRMLDFALVAGVLLLAAWGGSRNERKRFSPAAGYALAALGMLWLSLTLETSTWLYHRLPGFQAGGVSILWAVFALALLLGGILRQVALVRWLGLGLFAIVAVKVFLVDLRNLDAFYRIVAFVVLGLLVLAGSWLYMRFGERFQQKQSSAEEAEEAFQP